MNNCGKVKMGKELPQTILEEDDVRLIRACTEEYQRLMKQAKELSPSALAKKFGVSRYQIFRVSTYADHRHVK